MKKFFGVALLDKKLEFTALTNFRQKTKFSETIVVGLSDEFTQVKQPLLSGMKHQIIKYA